MAGHEHKALLEAIQSADDEDQARIEAGDNPVAEPKSVWALWAVPRSALTKRPFRAHARASAERGRWIENSVGLSLADLKDLRTAMYAMLADTPIHRREMLQIQRFTGWEELPVERDPVAWTSKGLLK